MDEATIVAPPRLVQEIQGLLITTVSGFLQARLKILSAENMRFLCEPWVHFFVHSALHRTELHGLPSSRTRDVANYPPERTVPGDTLSFFEYFRTPQYRQYLDATLTGEEAALDCRAEVHLLGETPNRLASTVCYKPCFPRDFRYRLQLYSLGRIGFLQDKAIPFETPTDWALRARLAAAIRAVLAQQPTELADWLAERAAELCPKSLLEHLPTNYAEKLHSAPRQALFSADAWHIIDDWKVYALAQKNRHGARWIGAPNALSHGSLAVFWQREFEISVLDTYLTWGWIAPTSVHCQLIQFNSPHFAGRTQPQPVRTIHNQGILISAAARPRHLLEYPYTPERFGHYLTTQLDLATAAHTLSGQPVAIRTRPRDLGWDVKTMVQALGLPQVTLEFQEGKFSERLAQSKLHICDNCSTTIAESLWANHPTLILINEDYFQIPPAAAPEYAKLASVGIFHQDKETLFHHLVMMGNNIDAWWSSPQTQQAISDFLQQQGRTGSTITVWKQALLTPVPNFNSA